MEKGRDASKQIRALLKKRAGQGLPATHKWLADETGIPPGSISLYATENPDSRRRLGMRNARKIAEALSVTVQDLGALAAEADDEARTAPGTLEELRATLEIVLAEQLQLRRRVDTLEAEREERADGSRGH